MQRSTRLLSGLAAAAFVAGALSACTTPAPVGDEVEIPTSSDQVSGEIDTSLVKPDLVVGVDNPHYLFHEDILIADREGYFAEYGIESVEIITSDDPLPGLIGGSLDFALFDTDGSIAAAAKGGDLRVMSIYLGGENNILGVRAGIDSAADLVGTTITGGQAGSRNDFLLRKLLTDNGVDPDADVQIVSTGGQSNERLQAIIAGTVDGATIQPRHELLLEEAGGSVLFSELTTAPQVGFSASSALSAEFPDTTAAFHAAILKARAWILDPANQDDALDYFESLGFDTPEAYRQAWAVENDPEYHTADGGFDIADMDGFIAEQIEFEEIAAGTDWREFVDLLPLWRAQANLGLPLRPSPEDFAG
jgi:ABC-type nitrate/sulfonate/bicarbonate transport system substrate-binding protein